MSDKKPDNSSDATKTPDPQSIEGLFLATLGKSTSEEREAFLDEACGDDADRRLRIVALLRAYDDAGSFLERPISGLPVTQSLDLSFLEKCDDPSLLGKLGQYEVYELIGRGGMGMVFRARDPKLNRIVAIKVLAPELAAHTNARNRFLREAQAAAAISHPHVVTIHAVEDQSEDEKHKLPFLVMECIVGQTLQQKIDKQGQLRLTEIVRISQQIAEGLSAAHKQGLVHRDIKPANILLENGVERVKITDFGLARAVDDATITRTGEVSGTPQYMSPEQAGGERIDHRSDMFSLGSVMYAMCTGRSPFRATSLAAAIKRVCQDAPRPIVEINPDMPEWLIELIDRLLHKDRDQRPQSATEVATFLEQYLAKLQQPDLVQTPAIPLPASEPATVLNTGSPEAPERIHTKHASRRLGRALLSAGTVGLLFYALAILMTWPTEVAIVGGLLLLLIGSLIGFAFFMRRMLRAPTGPNSKVPVAIQSNVEFQAKYFPTPLGFFCGAVTVLLTSTSVAALAKVIDANVSMLAHPMPTSAALLLLLGIGIWYLRHPRESEASLGAYATALISLLASGYLPFYVASAWPIPPTTGLIVAGVWITVIMVTIFLLGRTLRTRPNSAFLIAESRDSAAWHYQLVGGLLLVSMPLAMFWGASDQRLLIAPITEFAPQICATFFAVGAILAAIGCILKNSAKGQSWLEATGAAAMILLGPLGILLWLSQRDRRLHEEMRKLRDGDDKPREPVIEIPRESSTGTIGRYFAQFGALLVTSPILYVLFFKASNMTMVGDEQGLTLSFATGAIALALGLLIRHFKDEQKSLQRPLRLWRNPMVLTILLATIMTALVWDQDARRAKPDPIQVRKRNPPAKAFVGNPPSVSDDSSSKPIPRPNRTLGACPRIHSALDIVCKVRY